MNRYRPIVLAALFTVAACTASQLATANAAVTDGCAVATIAAKDATSTL